MRRSPPQPHLSDSEPGEQPPLAFVEEAGEQHDGGAQLLGHEVGVGQGPPESGGGHQQDVGRAVGASGVRGRPCSRGHWPARLDRPRERETVAVRCLTQGSPGCSTPSRLSELVDEVSGLGAVPANASAVATKGMLGAGRSGRRRRPTGRVRRSRRVRRECSSRRGGSSWCGAVEVLELAEGGAPARRREPRVEDHQPSVESRRRYCSRRQGGDGVGRRYWAESHYGTITDSRFAQWCHNLGRIAPHAGADKTPASKFPDYVPGTSAYGGAVLYCDTTAGSRKLFVCADPNAAERARCRRRSPKVVQRYELLAPDGLLREWVQNALHTD